MLSPIASPLKASSTFEKTSFHLIFTSVRFC
nr:MAG TPA: hypothetical protein [Bacteriophage sp.]